MRVALLVALLVCFAAPACGRDATRTPEARQGEWAQLARTSKVLVESSIHRPDGAGGTIVDVAWRVVNTGAEAESFRWQNKVLLDETSRRFPPMSGADTGQLAPNETSPLITNTYRVPGGVDPTKLWWGLYVDGALQYRVKLAPAPAEG